MNYKLSDQWTSQTVFTTTNSFSNGSGPYFYLMAGDSISRNDQSTNNSTQSTTEIQQNFMGDFHIGNLRNRFVGGLDFFYLNSDQVFGGLSSFDAILLMATSPPITILTARTCRRHTQRLRMTTITLTSTKDILTVHTLQMC